MKFCMLILFFTAGCLAVFGEFSKKEMKQLDEVEIAGSRTDTWKNDEREKFEVLEVNTFQNQDDPLDFSMADFRMRLAVELTDKQKNKYIVKFTGAAPTDFDPEYQGEDYWKLYMAHGDLERLKITGFAIQYGIMDGETFVKLAEESDNFEDVLAGLKARTTLEFPNRYYLRHYYMYDDSEEGVIESIESNVRAVKE